MPTLYLEWGSDFTLTPSGSLQIASGWDEVRQRIERFLLTNPQAVALDGTPIPADYIFHITYGLGAGATIDTNVTSENINAMIQKTYNAVLSDPDVDPSYPPSVTFTQPQDHTLVLVIYVKLLSGQAGQVAIQMSPS